MTRWSPPRPRTLTARLVVSTVLLIAVVAALIGAATTLAMRSYLNDRLDGEVVASLDRLEAGLSSPSGPQFDPRNQRPGTLLALVRGDGVDPGGPGDPGGPPGREPPGDGIVLGQGFDAQERLTDDAVRRLAGLDGDSGHSLELPGLGDYRVRVRQTPVGNLVAGLPARGVDDTLASLVAIELGVGLLALVTAASVGTVVVRRQLRPLRHVAGTARHVSTLPLSRGEISLHERVPDALTDERTEVGAVGSALNGLLAHVEGSLAARQRSEQQVRQFVADASHELRTPLATIKGYAELARRRPGDAEQVLAALAKVELESTRMTGLVEDLLLLARLDAGRPLASEPVDLTRLLIETVSDARVLAPGHRWQLALPEEVVEVVGDEPRLHQVAANLLTNARRYTPPGTTVTVTGAPGRFEVHDDGPGFPAELVPRAFERFVRGDVARARDEDAPEGTGLGLSLVAAIVHAHGGSVELASVPGDTRLTVRLPAAGGDAPATASGTGPPPSGR